MTQQELLGIVAEKIQSSVDKTTDILEVISSILSEELVQNGTVYIDDFGVFKTQKRAEYVSLNSETGEKTLMPPAIEVVFEPYLNVSIEAEIDYADSTNTNSDSDKIVEGDNSYNVLLFEPDLSLKNSVNSAFVNFEPTVLNEGVELIGIDVISDAKEMLETSTLEDVSVQEGKLSPIIPATHSITDESEVENVIPEQIVLQEDVRDHHSINEAPPTIDSAPSIKQRFSNSRIWVPIMGGVAITLAALFFFNGTTQKKCK